MIVTGTRSRAPRQAGGGRRIPARDSIPAPWILLAAAMVAVVAVAPATAQDTPPRCDEIEGFHLLDFWVGEWVVEDPAGNRQGTNRIEKVLDGCAVVENWRGAGGGEGMSLFTYDRIADSWKQVWVTGQATLPGGLKEKELVEVLAGGGVRFQGTIRLPDGGSYLDRTTLTPEDGGTVRQVIETSSDDGATWVERFVGIYRPGE